MERVSLLNNYKVDFSAPEIVNGIPYSGPETEVWAIGVIIYAMLYKTNPFQSATQIMEGKIKFPKIATPRMII